MNLRRQRLGQLGLTMVLVAFNLIALNFLVSGWSTTRLDLTEENLFSISPATERILTSLDEDLTGIDISTKMMSARRAIL